MDLQDNAEAVEASLTHYEKAWGLVSDACMRMASSAEFAGALLVNRLDWKRQRIYIYAEPSLSQANNSALSSIFTTIKRLFDALLSFLGGYDGPDDASKLKGVVTTRAQSKHD